MYLLEKIIDKCERSSNDWRRGACGGRTMRIEQSDYDRYGKKKLVDEIVELEIGRASCRERVFRAV